MKLTKAQKIAIVGAIIPSIRELFPKGPTKELAERLEKLTAWMQQQRPFVEQLEEAPTGVTRQEYVDGFVGLLNEVIEAEEPPTTIVLPPSTKLH